VASRARSIKRIAEAPANGRRLRRQSPNGGVRAEAATPTPGVDLSELTGLVGFLLRRAQLWTFQDFIRTLAPHDIRPAQFSVLAVIDANAGLSQITLAQALGIERAGLVRLLDGLERRGLVTRVPSTLDRRSHALYLTAEGRGALTRMRSLVMQHEKRLIEKIGRAHHKTLLRTLAVFAQD
jgi:DNA-binding MarR family transcriptional regulator